MEQEVWSSFSHDPRHSENASLRASDADRDVVHQVLTEAYADGRLDREEFDARSTAVGNARTLGDLPALLEGLVAATTGTLVPFGGPGEGLLTPVQIEERSVAKWREERRSALMGFVFASVLTWTIWAAVMFGGFPWPLFVMLGTGINAVRTAASRDDIVSRERRRLEKKQRKALGQPWKPDEER
ncbi:DUF1707 SHOCT-like domain-containing protein [Nocardioides sp. T2.26MG-1]|uniref:DUF1707 SHOCT-like domain-containing protein n=1 Tax=Nocardioides sp. T2.26MG-1 TaxID=3041166 RepID=UPI00253FCF95|nr:DUF1707 domain-containing protein [Nocardioides sp. T2.26MG-1]